MGTASALPISDRNPSAQVLCVHGRLFLIDCGEGTQQMLRRMHVSFVKIEAIFISHIHGDHIFGLFGLLSSMTMYGRTGALHIFGPQALGSILNFHKSFFGEGSNFEIVFHAVDCKEPLNIYESKALKVYAFPLNHKIDCFGYRFEEIPTPRRIAAAEARGEELQTASYAYCSDTAPFPELAGWLKGVNTIYHEATYTDDLADKALARFHSTTRQAARCALAAEARRLLVGHYSSRIREFDIYLKECREIFENTIAVQDGDVFEI